MAFMQFLFYHIAIMWVDPSVVFHAEEYDTSFFRML